MVLLLVMADHYGVPAGHSSPAGTCLPCLACVRACVHAHHRLLLLEG